jgi:hypothetical protein
MSRMFPFITKTWNPLGGECLYNCSYCWAKKLIAKFHMEKYTGPARIDRKALNQTFKPEDFVFVCDMTDLFGSWVPKETIQRILDEISLSRATFLLLTKNPQRYLQFDIPTNCVCGATIETDSKTSQLEAMADLHHPRKMVSVEPIMDFDLERFALWLAKVSPEFVAVGYDNYNNGLNEPSFSKTLHLIALLEGAGIKVYRKTLREKISVLTHQSSEEVKP